MHGLMFSFTFVCMAGCISWSCYSHACNGVALITFCSQRNEDLQLLFLCIFNLTINQGVLLTNDYNYSKGHYEYASVYVCTDMWVCGWVFLHTVCLWIWALCVHYVYHVYGICFKQVMGKESTKIKKESMWVPVDLSGSQLLSTLYGSTCDWRLLVDGS